MSSYTNLKPLCDAFYRNPSVKTVGDLRAAIESIAPEMLQLMQDFVLLPLVNRIDAADGRICSDDLKVQLFETVAALLRRTRFRKLTPFAVLAVVTVRQMFDAQQTRLLVGLSDELKLATCECLHAAFTALTSEVRHQLYATAEHRPLIGQIVYVALELSDAPERYQRVRLAAVGGLLPVCFNVHPKADANDAELRQLVAEHVYQMVPKVSAVLLRLIEGDVKEPLALKVAALRLLGRFVCLVFEDYDKQTGDFARSVPQTEDFRRLFEPTATAPTETANILNSAGPAVAAAPRTGAWLEAAMRRMQQPVFGRLLKHCGHEARLVRLELANMAVDLLGSCSAAVREHCEPVLQMVIVLALDEDETIAGRCKALLASLQSSRQAARHLDQLDALFDKQLLRCPRVLANGSAAEQLTLLRLLRGIVLGGCRLRLVLANDGAMQRLSTVLLFMAELGSGDGAAVEALRESHQLCALQPSETAVDAATAAATSGHGTPVWRQYQHLTTGSVRRAAEQLCAALGRSAVGEALFAELLQRMRDRTAGSNEALLVMQLMVAGEGWAEMARCRSLMDELLAGAEHWELDVRPLGRMDVQRDEQRPSAWYEDHTPGLYESAITIRYTDMVYQPAAAAGDDDQSSGLSIADAHHNVQHICLTLEAVAHVARSLRHLYQPYLLGSLYRLLVQAGSANHHIEAAGRHALAACASALGHDTIAELIAQNFDYIVHALRMRMRRAALTSGADGALAMLAVLLQYSRLDAVPQWQDIVQTVLEASADGRQQQQHALGYLQLFGRVLEHLERLQGSEDHVDAGQTVCPDETTMRQQWLDIISGAEAEAEQSGGDSDGNDEGDDQEPADADANADESETKAEQSTSQQITVAIMQRCIHYMPHKTRRVQCLTLDVLRCGVRLLHGHDDVLLPMVHDLWRPFVEQVRAGDPIVVRRCFGLMLEMSRSAKDFLYKRTATDVFPLLLAFLKQSAAESQKRIKDSSFEHCQSYHITRELFGQLPDLIGHLGIGESDLDGLLNAALPFLHADRHRATVQRITCDFLVAVCRFDAAAVFAKLAYQAGDGDCDDMMSTNARLILARAGLRANVKG